MKALIVEVKFTHNRWYTNNRRKAYKLTQKDRKNLGTGELPAKDFPTIKVRTIF